MDKLTKITFTKLSIQHGDTEPRQVEWTGYIGGGIPTGLIVAKLSKLGSHDEASPLWSVFHKCGIVVEYTFSVPTRKVAIAFAYNLAEAAEQVGLDWDWDQDTIQAWMKDAERYSLFKELRCMAAKAATEN